MREYGHDPAVDGEGEDGGEELTEAELQEEEFPWAAGEALGEGEEGGELHAGWNCVSRKLCMIWSHVDDGILSDFSL